MEINNVYNLDKDVFSLESFQKKTEQLFTDSYGLVTAQTLTHLDPKIIERTYNLPFLSTSIKVDNAGGWASVIQSLRTTPSGEFADANDRGDNKGLISLNAELSELKVLDKEGQSHWSDGEIQKASMQNISLVSKYIEAHDRVYKNTIDTAGWLGVGGQNNGILNLGFTSIASTGGVFGGLSGKQQYDNIAKLLDTQFNATSNNPTYMANVVVMPVITFNRLQSTPFNEANGSNITVLKLLQENYSGVNFMATPKATNTIVAFSTDEDVMKFRIPLPFQIGEVIKTSSYKYIVDSRFRLAGIDLFELAGGFKLTGVE